MFGVILFVRAKGCSKISNNTYKLEIPLFKRLYKTRKMAYTKLNSDYRKQNGGQESCFI